MGPQPFPYAVDFRGFWACPCQAAWIPAVEAEANRRGWLIGELHIWQLIGGAPASGGTHTHGGASDFAQFDPRMIWLYRQMGADASWHRPHNWDNAGGMEHAHTVLTGCPHNSPAAYQIDAVRADYNGLGYQGHAAPDDGPRPLSGRTWQQGIAWAKEQAQMTILFDASFNRPTPATVKQYGGAGVIGYVSDFPGKNLTKSECDAYIGAGLAVTFVWENSTADAFAGYAAGVAAAKKAVAQVKALGCPPGVVIFAACDKNDATVVQVAPYFQGWAATIKAAGYRDGIYGNGELCASGLCTYRWKVETWGSQTGVAHLIQQVIAPAPHPAGTDANQVLHGIPMWTATFAKAATPKPAPPLPQTAVHVHQALENLAMVPSTESANRLSNIRAAQAHLKESVA